jgi:N-acetylglucosamine repressor
MKHEVTGSFQLMKSLNRSVILNKIRQEGSISRAEIAKATKLTPPTVSSLVKELIESGIVIESNQGESKGGRKPTMLVINAKNFYIIGLDVGPNSIKAVVSDLNGHLVNKHESIIPINITNEGLIDLLRQSIKELLSLQEADINKFIGIGVAMHGVVDVKEGISLFAPNLNLRNIPIKESLEAAFKMVVKVENDARALALGESWFGNGNGIDNFVTINVGRGIGAGIIINGEIFHGYTDLAGEIGHMTIDISGQKCSCGNYGCLQTLASGPAISERAIKEISMGKNSLLSDMVDSDLHKIDGELVYKAAMDGDSLSIDTIKSTGIYLGIGITNIIHTFNPQRIIIGGGVSKAKDLLLNSVRETVQNRGLTDSAKNTEILSSELGDFGTALGAISLILVDLFSTKPY